MATVIESVTASADGYGRWSAEVVFAHTLSESDNRRGFSLEAQWANIRRRARRAIITAIAEREQKTGESWGSVLDRVRRSTPRLEIVSQNIDSLNRWHGVTFRESWDPRAGAA